MEEAESDPWNNFVSQARSVGEATTETAPIDDVGDGDYDADADKDASGWGMMDYIGRNILDSMQSAAGPLPNSDNSYVMSLCLKRKHAPQSVDMYQYPDNLPRANVFVDQVGWVSGPEANRYLTMGYCVWDSKGYRLHFHGTPFRYASVEVLRNEKRDICSQPHDEVPDLYVQIKRLKSEEKSSSATPEAGATAAPEKQTMPWDVRLPVPELNEEILAKLPNLISCVGMIFNDPHIQMARPCYTIDNKISYQDVGGTKCKAPESLDLESTNGVASRPINSTYPCIGVDQSFLSVEYPPTRVTVRHLDRDGKPIDIKQPNDALCSSCEALDFEDLFDWGMKDAEINLGGDAELRKKKDCSFCRIMGLLYEDGVNYLRRTNDPPEEESSYSMFALNPMDEFLALFVRNALHCNSTKPHFVLNQNIQREYFGPVVSLRNVRGDIRGNYTLDISGYLNYDLLKNMVHECDSDHGPDCGRKSADSNVQQGMVLVDVVRQCLVEITEKDMKYITLSYVWGKDRMFTTLRRNFKDLQVPGALSKVGFCQTIFDTIDLVRGLGVDYLWVDTLCIIQDDLEHKIVQIKNMAAIYGQAYLTVVALMGTGGNCALPGVSQPRAPLVEVVRGMPITARFPGLYYSAPNQVYEQRAWTFQERIISRRCLYLGERQAFFECGKGETSDHEQMLPEIDRCQMPETTNPLSLIDQKPETRGEPEAQGEPDTQREPETQGEPECKDKDAFSLFQLKQFNNLVMKYSERQMSYLSDIENAFVGVQDVIAQKCGWRFVAGLPIGVFDWALLWIPLGKLERRTWHQGSPDSPLVSPPSWSWFGWVGQVAYSTDAVGMKPSLQKLQPLVKSYVLEAGNRHVELKREESSIWHDSSVAAGAETGEDGKQDTTLATATAAVKLEDDSMFSVVDGTPMVLRFEADAVSTDGIDFEDLDIEWLSATMQSTNLRTSLLTGQRDNVMGAINAPSNAQRSVLELVALAKCQVLSAMRGGTWNEEKISASDECVIILIRWQGEGEGGAKDDGRPVAERVAIGYLSEEKWRGLGAARKEIRLA